jgi:Leucine-rich repeat (LRR) protein
MLLAHLENADFSNNNIASISKECTEKLSAMKEVNLDQNPYLSTEQTEQLLGKHSASKQNQAENKKALASPFKNLADALNFAKSCDKDKDKDKDKQTLKYKEEPQSPDQNCGDDNPNAQLIKRIRDEWKIEEQKPSQAKPQDSIFLMLIMGF